jgi:hypothetical protein
VLRRRPPVLLVTGLVTALLAAGCGVGGPPEITFTAGDSSVTARPTQYCDMALTSCDHDATAPVELAVPAGTPLRIEVPDDVAEAPWAVVFRYRSAAGEQIEGRSPLFGPEQRTEYALELPAPTDQLLTAQVQQLGAPPQQSPTTGEIEFPARGTWVLTTTG